MTMAKTVSTPTNDPSARGLLGLQGVERSRLLGLLTRSADYANALGNPGSIAPVLKHRIVANLFFEDSTRTRTSFSVAAKRLGADAVDLMGFGSSVSKGETLVDTALNIEAMGIDAIVVRARQAGAALDIARACRVPVINAGDGRHEHPTQGLLDTLTLTQAMDRPNFDLKGLRVAIVGDVASSRVARSAIASFTTLGAKVICVGPPAFAPTNFKQLGADVSSDLDAVLPKVDAVMMLRIQFERHSDGPASANGEVKKNSIASIREYRACYGLTADRAALLQPHAVVMHPGPMNRGLEIDGEVAMGPKSVILKQVTNGVAVRMAVLEACILGGAERPARKRASRG